MITICQFSNIIFSYEFSSDNNNALARIPTCINRSDLNFKYETLERATNFFDSSRKLGQGGAGSVFKGTLPDGRTVAVKRLFFNTRQWVDEFFNEVNLISRIQHKNLVGLLGCSIEGPESLLVYEYVPNKSVDQILFGKKSNFMYLSLFQSKNVEFFNSQNCMRYPKCSLFHNCILKWI